ncbi:MAG: hypothetical protein V2G42_08610 [bacterium JZ-2024 1]
MWLRRLRAYAIAGFVTGIGLTGWLAWLGVYVKGRDQMLTFRWAEDRWLPLLMALAEKGQNDAFLTPLMVVCGLGLMLCIALSGRRLNHPFTWFVRPLGVFIPTLVWSPWVIRIIASDPRKWWLSLVSVSVFALAWDPVPQEPKRARFFAIAPLAIAVGLMHILLLTIVRNLNSLYYFYSFQMMTNALAIALTALFAGIFLVIAMGKSEAKYPHFAPAFASLILAVIAVVGAINLAPPPYLIQSERVPPLSPEAGDEYLQYLWAGQAGAELPIRFRYSYRVPELEEVARRIKVPRNAPALEFASSFHEAMGDLLRLPMHTRWVREWVFPWIRYRVRHPCQPALRTFETLIAHDPFIDPSEVMTYREATKACESASPYQSHRAVILLLAHGFVEEANDEATAMLSRIARANHFLRPSRQYDEHAWRQLVEDAQVYFGDDSRKIGGITGTIEVAEGALKPGFGIAGSARVGASLLYPDGAPFAPASPLTGYVEPDPTGEFRILDLPIRDFVILVALREDSFQTDVSVEVSQPLVRLTSEKYEVRDLKIHIQPGGDFFRRIQTLTTPPVTLSQEALRDITSR